MTDYMSRALRLARRALGTTSPNPAVGVVVARGSRILGEGFTQPPPGDHAEVVALRQAGELARGSQMYVTLEPCCHTGKRTPPCTRAVIAAGVVEVHIATLDPNPQVAGRGKQELEAVGIKVVVGEGGEAARELNQPFFKLITTGLPLVTAKFALSLDGKIATRSGDSRWISGEKARRFAHRLRREADAILVGINTVLADDPRLTARVGQRVVKIPLRVVVDSRGRLPLEARLLREPGETVIAVTQPLPSRRAAALSRRRAQVWHLPGEGGRVDLKGLMQALAQKGVTSVLVEGGGVLLASLLEAGLVDRIYAIICPIIVGGREAPTPVAGAGVERMAEALRLKRVSVRRLGEDTIISAWLNEGYGAG